MKTIILMRHSQVDQTSSLPNARLPLSEEGIRRANEFFRRSEFGGIERTCASNYKRAYQTAGLFAAAVLIDSRLAERRVGEEADASFWEKQYQDPEFRNAGGESLREVGQRVDSFVTELLDEMKEGEKALLVSHAAAICGYLMKYCSISVVNADKKLRRITFGGKTVLHGRIETPGAFVMRFDEERLADLIYIE